MATVTKDFRVKAGLVVEGSTATVDGHDILTEGLVDAKGDLLVASGADAVTRVALGTNGYILTADDNETAGVKWAAAPAVGSFETSIVFEGATANAFETTLEVTDPTADRTITLPDATGTVALTSDITSAVDALSTNDIEENIGATNLYFTNQRAIDATSSSYEPSGAVSTHASLTSTHGVSGDIVGTSDSQTLTNKTISGDDNTLSNIPNNALDNDYITIQGSNISLGNGITLGTDDISEGQQATNLWFTNQRAIDATSSSYEPSGAVSTHASLTSTHGVSGNIVGDIDTQNLSNKTIDDQLNFGYDNNNASYIVGETEGDGNLTVHAGNDLTLSTTAGDIILDPDGHTYIGSVTAANEVATHGYVDNAVSGLSWKQAVNLKVSSNVNIANAAGTYDGHAVDSTDVGYRFLLTDQNTASENGIYVGSENAGNLVLTRPADADVYSELIGAAVYVMEGTQFGSTSWVQGNHYMTDFTGQDWTQFSGQGSVTAGDGITVDGLEVSIDRTTVDTWYEASGAVSTHSDLTTGVHGVSGDVVGTSDTQNLSNKTFIDTTYFTDGVTISTEGQIAVLSPSHEFEIKANSGDLGLKTVASGADVVISSDSGSVIITADEAAYYGSATANNELATIGNLQDGDVNATPAYTGITLPDALLGTATALAGTSATTIDTWSATTYSSAKYIVQMKKGTDIEVIELLVTIDGSNNVYLTEYADVISNVELGTTNAVYSSGNVLLQVTGASSDTDVKVQKVYIEA